MKEKQVSLPTIGLIAGTRVVLGVGVRPSTEALS